MEKRMLSTSAAALDLSYFLHEKISSVRLFQPYKIRIHLLFKVSKP